MVDLYANVHYGGLQMLIEKMNVYASCSCPIMGIDSSGMHTINLLRGATYHPTWVLYVTNYYLIVAVP
jgi:hypothetical protein